MIIKKLLHFETPYISMQNLHEILQGYQNPRDCVSRLVKSGELLRLKNGFFLIAEKIKDTSIPFEQIANLLYGPSYISLEYALSYYGIIPEASYVRTSMTINQSKHFHTKIGTFSYYHIGLNRYFVGVTHMKNALGGFYIATPEKALADHVFQVCQGLGPDELLEDLIESRRIEIDTLKSLDKKLLHQIAVAYRSKIIKTLEEVLINL